MGHQKWSTIKRSKGIPDFEFPWIPAVGGPKTVRVFFAEAPAVTVNDVRELAEGATKAHDEDVLEALVRSFGERHELEVVNFAAAPDAADRSGDWVTVGLRARTTLGANE